MPKTSRHSHQDYAHCTRLYKYAWKCSGVWAESPDCGALHGPDPAVSQQQRELSKVSDSQSVPSVCLFGRLIIPWVSCGLIAIEYGYDLFVYVYLHPSPFVTIENGYFYQHFHENKKVKV